MKKILAAILGVGLVAAVAVAATQDIDLNVSSKLSGFTGGVIILPAQFLTTDAKINASRITRSLGASAVIDFVSVTITCEDSSAITVTGARAGDACYVGAPTTISGAGTGLNSTFSCYVSAANAVKVRHCAAGTADNPASATYYVRVTSSQ